VSAPLDQQLRELADDVGRLRRRLRGDGYEAHLGDRLAGRVHLLANLTGPTAGELVRAGAPVDLALADVDRRTQRFVALLGDKARERERGEAARRRLLGERQA
jgi:hypothetical protein